MTQKEIHQKAIRLVEGGTEEIDGLWFRYKKINSEHHFWGCYVCELDSICCYDHVDICSECDFIADSSGHLILTGK